MPDLTELLVTENQTVEATRQKFPGATWHVPLVIDTLLGLNNFLEPSGEEGTDAYYFGLYAGSRFSEAPYDLRCGFLLLERGYYTQCANIARSLLEVIVDLRYLKNHQDLVTKFLTKPETKRITITTDRGRERDVKFFEQFKDLDLLILYNELYGRILSQLSHRGSMAMTMRLTSSEPAQLRVGPVWDERYADIFHNALDILALAYLRCYPLIFPNGLQQISPDLRSQYEQCVTILTDIAKAHRTSFRNTTPWIDQLEKLWVVSDTQ